MSIVSGNDDIWRNALVDSALDAVIIMDHTGKIVDFNASAEQIFGYEKSFVLNKLLADLIIPEELRAAHGSRLKTLYAGESPKILGKRLQLPALRSDGSQFPAELIVVQVPTSPPVFVGTIRDISERVETEKALRESAMRFRNLADSTAQLIWLCDHDGNAIWFNQAWERFSGLSQQDLLEHPRGLFALVHPDDVALLSEMPSKENQPEVSTAEVRFLSTTGDYCWHLCNRARTQTSKDGAAFVWSAVEITSRREIEEALRLTQTAMDFAADAVFWVLEDASLDYVNEQACKMLGYSREELLQLRVPDFSPDIPDGGWDKHWSRLCEEKNLRFETTHRRKDGMVFPVEISLNYVEYKGAKRNCAFVRDISERHRFQEMLSKSIQEARAASRAKSEFLAIVSHEMRTPLTSIVGSLDLCLQSNTDPDTEELLKLCQNSGNHLKSLIVDVLDYSQIQSGKFSLQLGPTDLNETLASIRGSFEPKLAQKGLEFRTSSTLFQSPVLVDERRLTQVVSNLLSNAIKFTEEGFVGLTVEKLEEVEEHITVKLVVEDSGVGIPYEHRTRIFGKFEQIESGPSRMFGGVGLGLSICKQLVELMRGTIEIVDGAEGQTQFVVRLSFEKAKSEACEPMVVSGDIPDLNPEPNRAGCVLVVEDDPSSRVILGRMIERLGLKVLSAPNGSVAIGLMQQHADIQLVFMDIMMPEMDGVQATEVIRQSDKETPVVAMSAHSQYDDSSLNGLGIFDGFMEKPVEMQRLSGVLQRYLTARSTGEIDSVNSRSLDVSKFYSQCDHDAQLASEVVDLFRVTAIECWNILQENWSPAGNFDELRAALHKLKGASQNLGAIQLPATCERMQASIQTSQAGQLELLGGELDELLNKISEVASQLSYGNDFTI